MQVIRHHRKAKHIHAEDSSQKIQRPSLPCSQTASSLSLSVAQLLSVPPVLVTLAGEFINAAQKPTPHTPIHTVCDLNLTLRQHLSPIHPCDVCSPVGSESLDERKSTRRTEALRFTMRWPWPVHIKLASGTRLRPPLSCRKYQSSCRRIGWWAT